MRFATVDLDPPWKEKGGGKIKRGADRHFKVMKMQDIIREVWHCPLFNMADNAHMYEWVTHNFLPQGIEVMRQLGFRYVHTIPWIKLQDGAYEKLGDKELERLRGKTIAEVVAELLTMGLGQYFRGSSEMLLFGVRGQGYNVCTEAKDIQDVIFGPLGRHSEKPESSFELIEARSHGPYLELFARNEREGWTSWGDELF